MEMAVSDGGAGRRRGRPLEFVVRFLCDDEAAG